VTGWGREKIAQNLAEPIFYQNQYLGTFLVRWKKVFFYKENYHPTGENSPNLVTLSTNKTWAYVAGWPDWANIRPIGDCLLWTVTWKLLQFCCYCWGTLILTKKNGFGLILGYILGNFFPKLIWSPRHRGSFLSFCLSFTFSLSRSLFCSFSLFLSFLLYNFVVLFQLKVLKILKIRFIFTLFWA
jgi:hypothetical protein